MLVNSFFIFCLLNFYLLAGNYFLKFSGPKSICDNAMISEKIIAGIFFSNFFFLITNFFLPTKNLFISISFFLFCFFLIFKYFFLIKKNFYFFLLISIAFAPLSIYINPGFDGGLYHLPFQKVLQDQNIHFGLTNVHNRYGLTGITSYFNSFLWNKTFVNILSSNQTILFLTFFLIIKDNINLNKGYLNVYIICAIFTFPIWYRYAPLQYGTVDVIFSIFVFSHFLYLSKLIFQNYNKHKDFAEVFFIFCLCTSFAFAVKPTGSILIINLIIVFLYLYKKIFNFFKELFLENYIFIIFFVIWFIRNLIISGCFIYPVVFTCFNFDWFNFEDILNINTSIKIWNTQFFNLIINFIKVYLNFNIVFIGIILFFFIIIKFFSRSILYFCKKYKIQLFSIVIIFFLFFIPWLDEPKLLTYLLEQKKFDQFFASVKKEFFYILVFNLITLCILFLSFNKISKFFVKSKINFKSYLPLLLFLIIFLTWLLKAPHPRLGQYLFFLFLPSCAFIFFNYEKIKFRKITLNLIYISIFFVIINLTILTNLKMFQVNDIFFHKMQIQKTDVSMRNSFGYKPLNFHLQCWAEPYCYPYEDVFIYKKIGYYNFYKKLN